MPEKASYRASATLGLSARLLVLTVFFVMLAEFLIYTPSISRFRRVYLEEHVATARLAMVALETTPGGAVDGTLEERLLLHAGVHGIVLKRPGQHILVVRGEMPLHVHATFDLREGGFFGWIGDAFTTLAQDDNRVLRVIGVAPVDPSVIVEVLMDETPMRQAMYGYSQRILELSIVISLITAGLVFLSLQWLMVRPMRRITESMTAFREAPEDEGGTIVAGRRGDEIGVAQRELAVMQDEVRAALRQKTRLATLGAAVAKINHDLRNTLSTAVLVSDGLSDIDDPEVRRLAPRLMTAIDRAIALCSQTLAFAGDATPRLSRSRFSLHGLVNEAGSTTGLAIANELAAGLQLEADREQLFRVLTNLARNAEHAGAGSLRFTAAVDNGRVAIDVADDGSGLPDVAWENLFTPFAGSTREGGTGLGLVIARDIVRAHGGDISLAATGAAGTTFRLELPAIE